MNLRNGISSTRTESERKSIIKNIFSKKSINTGDNMLRNNYTDTKTATIKPFLIDLVKPLFVEIERKDKNKIRIKKNQKSIFHYFVNNNYFVGFMTGLTIIALFANDVQLAWMPAEFDLAFDIIQTIMMALFSLEIIFTCLAKKSYINSFFFWLDLIATLSFIQDISFIFNPLLNLAYR
jgi:hypothetical protein